MDAVRGVMPASGSVGGAGAPGCRAPHLAQYWSAGLAVLPQLLQKGISTNEYVTPSAFVPARYRRPDPVTGWFGGLAKRPAPGNRRSGRTAWGLRPEVPATASL